MSQTVTIKSIERSGERIRVNLPDGRALRFANLATLKAWLRSVATTEDEAVNVILTDILAADPDLKNAATIRDAAYVVTDKAIDRSIEANG